MDFIFKECYTTDDLLHIMRLLRAPGGCPWDREQTHGSIRSNMLEEAHEAIEAIDADDMPALCEELGDVLMQVVFHACMEEEAGGFTYADVVDGLCHKLIVRHPHVFGETAVSGTGEVLVNWDRIKRAAKGDKPESDLLAAVPRSLPALMRAAKVQGRAKRAGFDWPDIAGPLAALDEETREFKEALRSGETAAIEDEFGDVLFSAVNVSRFIDVDAELALTRATDKFIGRFRTVEQLAAARGIDMATAGIETLDELWALAKKE
ncbi:MAG: nucleoside triphosphate pyrophosphohydrolase [Oscillospiraceae bacterium]|nr:nucleoside triphosphate pyrophosphohydrolase [Oscillospiraceae bacterium]